MARTITVKGVGNVSATPDYVNINLNLESSSLDYEAAMEQAAKKIEYLTATLEMLGIEKKEIKTTNFNVRTDYDSVKDKDGSYMRIFCGFTCHHQLKIGFDFDTNRLAQVLSAVAKCLAEPELSISFTVKDANAVNRNLLASATANARAKAEILTAAANVSLGPLLSIDYNWGELDIYSTTRYDACTDKMLLPCPSAPTIDIEPEDIHVSDTVTFVWEIA